MFEQRAVVCPVCKTPLAESADCAKNEERRWKCDECEIALDGLWSFGCREGVLEKLVEEYKYGSVRAMGRVLAECADVAVGDNLRRDVASEEGSDAVTKSDLGDGVVVVPLPTIGRHVRERGFDHTKMVAEKLAKRRGWKCEAVLGRAADTVQVGAKREDREKQAKKAYEVVEAVDDGKVYLLLDDVWTTGASMLAAAEVLRNAGAKKVYGVVLAVSRPKND